MLIAPQLLEVFERLGVAAAAGLMIGLEREVRRQPAGIRTNILIAVAAALYTLTGANGFGGAGHDPSRVAAQIVSGMGFLGGGVILHSGPNVRGLTTAATMWTVGAIGMAAGAGYYPAAAGCTVLTVIVLAIRPLTRALSQGLAPRVTVHGTGDDLVGTIVQALAELSISAGSVSFVRAPDMTAVLWRLQMPPECSVAEMVGRLSRLQGVKSVETHGLRAARRLHRQGSRQRTSGRHRRAGSS